MTISYYSEAMDSLEGLITQLDKICTKSTPLTNEYLLVVLEFIRSFKFKGQKLLHGGCISNREIVAKFLSCLDSDFRKTVMWQMSQRSLNNVSSESEATRRKTHHYMDPIEFEALLKVSEDLAQSFNSYNVVTNGGTSGMTARSTVRSPYIILQRWMEPATSSDRMVHLLEDLNKLMARNMDILVNMSKEDSQCHVETTKSLEKMTMLLSSLLCKDKENKTIPSSQPSWRKCYYCWGPGHFIVECQFLTADIAEGKIEAHARIDSEQFTKESLNLSPRDRVDEQWKNAKAFFIEDLPEDGFVQLVSNGLVTLQSDWNQDRTPFFIKDLPEDGFVDLMPVCSDIITLNCNLNVRNKTDNLISDLQEKARCVTEECNMWKVSATEQTNMSVPIAPRIYQNVPQSTV